MTLQEFSTTIGGDYEGAMKRLRTDKLAVRLIGKFPEDGSFALLQAGMDAHIVKPVDMDVLTETVARLITEARGVNPPKIEDGQEEAFSVE